MKSGRDIDDVEEESAKANVMRGEWIRVSNARNGMAGMLHIVFQIMDKNMTDRPG